MPAEESWTLEGLSRAYEHHLQHVQGLKLRTIRGYWRFVHQFLLGIFGEDRLHASQLTPQAVVGFITSLQPRFCPSTMKLVTTSLRSFFRFLRGKGLCDAMLEAAVPAVACRRLSNLPRGLTDEEIRRLVASLGTESLCGRRDRAMVLCLSSLAMRPGELAELRLDDIDWRAGSLLLRARKTGRGTVLPLPQEVGNAIVDYLREERPETAERRVFVRHSGQCKGQGITASIVSLAVVRALKRARITAPIAGAYVLRHTVASGMVRHGTSLKEVADFLGHRHLNTTAIYAKVDVLALRDAALPWPEVTP